MAILARLALWWTTVSQKLRADQIAVFLGQIQIFSPKIQIYQVYSNFFTLFLGYSQFFKAEQE
jgi:hypothetical protein